MSGATDGLVDLVIEAAEWAEALPELGEVAETAARAAVGAAGLQPARCAVGLLACDDRRIAELNARFRGVERPTNVLSWPAFELRPCRPGGTPPRPPAPRGGAPRQLGDVAIALQTAAREAESRGISLKSHALHLILHGCLHLLGYDHETEEDAVLMEGIESRVLTGLGLSDPYLIVEADAAAPHPDR